MVHALESTRESSGAQRIAARVARDIRKHGHRGDRHLFFLCLLVFGNVRSMLPPLAPWGAMGEGKAQRPFERFVEPMGGLNPYHRFLAVLFSCLWKTRKVGSPILPYYAMGYRPIKRYN